MKKIWLINDDEGSVHFLKEDIAEVIPGQEILVFESAFEAWKARSGGSPWLIIIDLSAVGSIVGGPNTCYGPICTLLVHFPGAYVVINSAVSKYFAEEVVELVHEACPDSVVKLVDWSMRDSADKLQAVLRELMPLKASDAH